MTNALGNAVDSGAFAETFDRALAPLGVTDLAGPATAERICRAIRGRPS